MANVESISDSHWQFFGGFHFHRAFIDLGSALRWMFWGLMLQICGAALLLTGLAAIGLNLPARALIALSAPGMILWIIGSFFVLRGQFRCMHLQFPHGLAEGLPGRRWIRLAYFCELASILLRLLRNWVGRGVLGFFILPLELFSLVFLLLFLRKIADVIARADLLRWINFVFACLALTIICGTALPILNQVKEHLGRPMTAGLGLTAMAVGTLSLIGGIVAYCIVLWRMGTAATAFGRHLLEFNVATPQTASTPE